MRWTPTGTKKYQDEMWEFLFGEFRGLRIFVMNVEALSTPRGTKAAVAFLQKFPDNIMIVDESTTIKNRKATRTKNIVKLSDFAKYKRILTGSPITRARWTCLVSAPSCLTMRSASRATLLSRIGMPWCRTARWATGRSKRLWAIVGWTSSTSGWTGSATVSERGLPTCQTSCTRGVTYR